MHRLKQIIHHAGLSQKDFAERIGISGNALTELFKGRSKGLSEQTLKAIAVNFHVNINWLLTGEGEMFLLGKKEDKMSGLVTDEPSTYLKTDVPPRLITDINNYEVIEGGIETYPDITLVEQVSRTGWFRNLTAEKKFIVAGLDEIQDADYIQDLKGSISLKVRNDRMKAEQKHLQKDNKLRQKGEAG